MFVSKGDDGRTDGPQKNNTRVPSSERASEPERRFVRPSSRGSVGSQSAGERTNERQTNLWRTQVYLGSWRQNILFKRKKTRTALAYINRYERVYLQRHFPASSNFCNDYLGRNCKYKLQTGFLMSFTTYTSFACFGVDFKMPSFTLRRVVYLHSPYFITL